MPSSIMENFSEKVVLSFHINSKKLTEVLVKSMKIIQPKSPVIMYSAGLFQVKDGKLSITATDMDHTLVSELEVEGDDCEFILKIQDIHDVVKKIQGRITFLVEKNRVKIHNEQSKVEFLRIEEEFIKTSLENVRHVMSVENNLFNDLFCFFSITSDEWNFALQINNNYMQGVGNNGKCLVFSQMSTNNINSDSFAISHKTLNLLCKHTSSGIEVYQQNNQLIFKFEEGVLWSRLLNNRSLNYERILGKKNLGKLTLIDKKKFLESLNRVSLLSSKISRTIKLNFQSDKIIMQASDASRGQAEESIVAESQLTNDTVTLNCDSLINALKTIKSSVVYLYYTGPIGHFFITNQDSSLIHVVMPLNSVGN